MSSFTPSRITGAVRHLAGSPGIGVRVTRARSGAYQVRVPDRSAQYLYLTGPSADLPRAGQRLSRELGTPVHVTGVASRRHGWVVFTVRAGMPGAGDASAPARLRSAMPGDLRQPGGSAAVQVASAAARNGISGWEAAIPEDLRREMQEADQAASERNHAAQAAYTRALERFEREDGSPEAAQELRQARTGAIAAGQAYTRDGRHIAGRHQAAMLRWSASLMAERDAAGPSAASSRETPPGARAGGRRTSDDGAAEPAGYMAAGHAASRADCGCAGCGQPLPGHHRPADDSPSAVRNRGDLPAPAGTGTAGVPSGEFAGYEATAAGWNQIRSLSAQLDGAYERQMAALRALNADAATIGRVACCRQASETHMQAADAAAADWTSRQGAVKEIKDATGARGDQALHES